MTCLRKLLFYSFLALFGFLACMPSNALTIPVSPDESIQAVIDVADEGDVIQLEAGTYRDNIDFKGKGLSLRGVGSATILMPKKRFKPVISIKNGETNLTLVDQIQIFAGDAKRGAAVFIKNSSPRINRNLILGNKAKLGSAIYIDGSAEGATPAFFNNIIAFNTGVAVFVKDSSPSFLNNTIVANALGGIFAKGRAGPNIDSSIIAFNGTRASGKKKARGFGAVFKLKKGQQAQINNCLFHENGKGDLQISKELIPDIEDANGGPLDGSTINGNVSGNPLFVSLERVGFDFSLFDSSPAIDNGNPDPAFNDLDASPNDIGHRGGLFPNPDFFDLEPTFSGPTQ